MEHYSASRHPRPSAPYSKALLHAVLDAERYIHAFHRAKQDGSLSLSHDVVAHYVANHIADRHPALAKGYDIHHFYATEDQYAHIRNGLHVFLRAPIGRYSFVTTAILAHIDTEITDDVDQLHGSLSLQVYSCEVQFNPRSICPIKLNSSTCTRYDKLIWDNFSVLSADKVPAPEFLDPRLASWTVQPVTFVPTAD